MGYKYLFLVFKFSKIFPPTKLSEKKNLTKNFFREKKLLKQKKSLNKEEEKSCTKNMFSNKMCQTKLSNKKKMCQTK